jgi:lipase chaperone LimK
LRRRRLEVSLAFVLVLGAAFFGVRHLRADKHEAVASAAPAALAQPERARPQGQKATQKASPAVDTREASPFKTTARSLTGTEVDGALRVSPDGDLILGPELIRLFDYFLTTDGEESDATIKARILAAIRERVSGPAAVQAAAMLDKYLAYREAAKSLRLGKDQEADPKARLDAIRALRRKHFGEEAAEKLFGDEEREGAVAIEESRIAKDSSLSAEEKASRLAELEERLPAAARAARERSVLPLRAGEEEAELRAKGATDDDIHDYRAATYGDEAADRLADLDRQRAEWQKRLDAFRAERARIAETTPDEAARQKAEDDLLARSFSEAERRRVRATLAMEQEQQQK